MRERWARRIAYLTGSAVLLLAAGLSWRLNHAAPAPIEPAPATTVTAPTGPTPPPAAPPATGSSDERLARGRDLVAQLGCADCHPPARADDPASAFDGVATRRSVAETRDWIVAAPAVASRLPRRARSSKQAYGERLSAADLEVLVDYVRSAGTPTSPGTATILDGPARPR